MERRFIFGNYSMRTKSEVIVVNGVDVGPNMPNPNQVSKKRCAFPLVGKIFFLRNGISLGNFELTYLYSEHPFTETDIPIFYYPPLRIFVINSPDEPRFQKLVMENEHIIRKALTLHRDNHRTWPS